MQLKFIYIYIKKKSFFVLGREKTAFGKYLIEACKMRDSIETSFVRSKATVMVRLSRFSAFSHGYIKGDFLPFVARRSPVRFASGADEVAVLSETFWQEGGVFVGICGIFFFTLISRDKFLLESLNVMRYYSTSFSDTRDCFLRF